MKLPQRPAGERERQARRHAVDPDVVGRLVPMSALLTAEVTETCSSVAAASVPSAFSLLSGSVTPVKWATKPRPLGQLSPATAAAVVIAAAELGQAGVAFVADEQRRRPGGVGAGDDVGLGARRGADPRPARRRGVGGQDVLGRIGEQPARRRPARQSGPTAASRRR